MGNSRNPISLEDMKNGIVIDASQTLDEAAGNVHQAILDAMTDKAENNHD